MAAYWIAHIDILDPTRYTDYTSVAPAAFQKYQARFLARGGQATCLEGQAYQRQVVIEFRDYETALACYHSPEYQAAKAKRQGCSVAQITIVNGL
ncbi:DUF1330 domain-containing protein [Alcaligenes sp. 13f]|uniref:DUF1330 domain-containing protein n=1 Tax=Alcaligenes sp. 13f TaxID=2841924 RepID=UPI001CF6550A|nr:DUF1330 domain-containing protein [Alcaligenes sp. 13f]MCB4320764.1 DUF1330 domain-containing protein [Alcaligenes sp. 13f]